MYIKSYVKYVFEILAAENQFDDWRRFIYDMCKINYRFLNRSEQQRFIFYAREIKDKLRDKYHREIYEANDLFSELVLITR